MELTGGIRGKNSFFFFLSFSFRGHEFVPVRRNAFLPFFISIFPPFFFAVAATSRSRAYVVKVSIANPVPIHFPPD